MKIAFVFLHPFSESMGSVVRVKELALSLGKTGVEVYIFTPYARSYDLFTNVHVISASEFINTTGFSKLVYKISKLLYYNRVFPNLFSKNEAQPNRILAHMIKALAKLIEKKNIDLIQIEQDATLPIGIGLKRETGLPLLVDIHNISSEELVAAGILEKKSATFLALQGAIKNGLSEADHAIVVSEFMHDYVINNYGLPSAKVSVVPPGGRPLVDESVIKKRTKPAKVVYAGLVAYREHVDLFVKSMPFISRKFSDAQFHITNKGEAIKNIKQLAGELGVNPEFFWYDSYDAVNSFLSLCHVGVLTSSDDIARRMGTPAKLFNYLSLGLPVVANDIGCWSKIIQDERVGLLTSDNPEDFAETVNTLLSDESLRVELSHKALAAVTEKYNWDKSSESLVKVYESFI